MSQSVGGKEYAVAELRIDDFPDDQYRRVCDRATQNHRSVEGEAIALIETVLELERMEALKEISRQRASLPKSSDSLDLLREDRDR